MKAIAQVAEARQLRVSTAEMNRFLEEVDFERASSPSGKPTRLYYLTQAGVAPPIFIAFTNRSGKLHFSFERFLENRIREKFGFAGHTHRRSRLKHGDNGTPAGRVSSYSRELITTSINEYTPLNLFRRRSRGDAILRLIIASETGGR